MYTLYAITSVQLAYLRMLTKCHRNFTLRPAFLLIALSPPFPCPPQSLHLLLEMYVVNELFYTVPVLSGAKSEGRKKVTGQGVLMPMTTWIRPMAMWFLFVRL